MMYVVYAIAQFYSIPITFLVIKFNLMPSSSFLKEANKKITREQDRISKMQSPTKRNGR